MLDGNATIQLVIEVIEDVLRDKLQEPPPMNADTVVLAETGLDSLDLAVVVIRMEERTGRDPFHAGFIHFRTIGELARLYER